MAGMRDMMGSLAAQGYDPVEGEFQRGIRDTPWFSEFVAKHGEEPNLNDKDYDYRKAWAAGARPNVRDPGDNMLHWSSQFKGENHPNRYVDGVDTITGRRIGDVAALFEDRMTGSDPTAPPTTREQILDYRRSPVGQAQAYYREAPKDVWRQHDAEAIQDEYGGVDIHGMKLPPPGKGEPRAWFDAIVPQEPWEIGLAVAGPAGRLAGRIGKIGAAATGMMGSLVDPAEAANPLRVVRSTSALDLSKPKPEWFHRIANSKLDRPLDQIPVDWSGTAPPMSTAVDPQALAGKFLLPLPGDPTVRGRTVMSVDNVPLGQPFETHGGRPYIDELGGFANAKGAATAQAGRVQRYQDKYGDDVLGAYMKMGPRSMDFSQHSWGLLSRMFENAPMTKEAVTEMNQAIKARTGVANFPSVKNPKLEQFVGSLPDPVRKEYITAVEQARGTIAGVPDVVAARYAVTEPQLLNAPTSSSGLTMTRLTGKTGPSSHPDYPTHLEGEGAFGLGQMLPREVMFRDMVEHLDTLPKYANRPDRWIQAIHQKPPKTIDYGQLADPRWVDTTSKYIESVGRMGDVAAFDDYLKNVLKWK